MITSLLRSVASLTATQVLLGLLLLGGGSCSPKTNHSEDVLIVGIESEVKTLDPRYATGANAFHVVKLFTDALVTINDQLLPEPQLAASIETLSPRAYRFVLRSDISFHDGKPITADDVISSLEQYRAPGIPYKGAFDAIDRVVKENDTTVTFFLKKPNAAFLVGDLPALRILPKHLALDDVWMAQPVGSGVYRFLKKDGRDLIFERREGSRAPYRQVIVRVVEDPTTRFLALKKGELDILFNALDPEKTALAKQSPDFQVSEGPSAIYQYIGFNFRQAKFQNPKFRQALALAVNRQELIDFKMKGLAQPAVGLLSPANFYFHPGVTGVAFDLERAKTLLQESGLANASLEIKSSNDPAVVGILLVVKSQWEKLGLKVELRSSEFGSFYEDVKKGNFDVFSLRWVGVIDPDMYYIFHSAEIEGGRNRGAYRNAALDRLLDAGRAEADVEKRKVIYAKVQELVAAELPYISLWHPMNTIVARKGVKNIRLHPSGAWDHVVR